MTRNIPLPPALSDQIAEPNLAATVHAVQDPWIFREGRKSISGSEVIRGIAQQLRRGSPGWVDALIQAGELEAALADAGHSCTATSTELTDSLAAAVCTDVKYHVDRASEILGHLTPPDWVSISPPEGFTYYALHPLDFAKVTERLEPAPLPCAVIGIRSIGTTLSAMTVAALRLAGRSSSRITVRPTGHPYSRLTDFDGEQHHWIRDRLMQESQFIIVDEGPGRSGSTFLSVAEALQRAGVPRELITIIGSRQLDTESLCAENAAGRWSEFRYLATSPSVNARFREFLYVGGGCWRDFFFADKREWPESWTQTERLKFISPDRKSLFKFEGMGRIGADARQRASALAEGGFGPKAKDAGDGFLAYELVVGRHLTSQDMSPSLLNTMARYCAFRSANFVDGSRSVSQLKQMVEFNIAQEFGIDAQIAGYQFDSADAVLVDGRMQPYEWISTGPDSFIKTDGIDHGDNHFFPGPCDIGWDLASIAIEWDLPAAAIRHLLNEFARESGSDVAPRLPAYLLAYAVFRMSFCRMARNSVGGSTEQPRLDAAYRRYRTVASNLLSAGHENLYQIG